MKNNNKNKKIQRCRSASSLSSRLKKRCIFWSTNVQVSFESTQNTPFEFSRQKSTFQSLIFTVTSKCTCRMPFLWENKNDIPAKSTFDRCVTCSRNVVLKKEKWWKNLVSNCFLFGLVTCLLGFREVPDVECHKKRPPICRPKNNRVNLYNVLARYFYAR